MNNFFSQKRSLHSNSVKNCLSNIELKGTWKNDIPYLPIGHLVLRFIRNGGIWRSPIQLCKTTRRFSRKSSTGSVLKIM